MATYRVPQASDHPPRPASTTQPPGGFELSRTPIDPPDSRRASESRAGDSGPPSSGAAAATRQTSPGQQAAAAARPVGALSIAGPAANKDLSKSTPAASSKEVSPASAASDDHHEKKGWSRGRKACCGVCLLLLAAIVTLGVLIAFLVRTPSVSYSSTDVICPNNDYTTCLATSVTMKVHLVVNNPNIIGATVNADLKLYKTDGTFLGPGTVDDTSVKARGDTDIVAVFNVTSSNAYDLLVDLFLPPTSAVTIVVRGKVYIHVGLLRPSISFSRTFTVEPSTVSSAVSAIAKRAGVDLPAISDAADAFMPGTGDAIRHLLPGMFARVSGSEDTSENNDVVATVQIGSRGFEDASGIFGGPVDPVEFARALVAVAPSAAPHLLEQAHQSPLVANSVSPSVQLEEVPSSRATSSRPSHPPRAAQRTPPRDRHARSRARTANQHAA